MTAANDLLNLQKAQLVHDEIAHRDILCLPIQQRIKHMVLHFAKYTGHLVEARELRKPEALASTMVDTWIIVLASANMLNIPLSKELRVDSFRCKDLLSLGQAITASNFSHYTDPYDLALFELGKITGRMAKGCESLDHMERFDSRDTLEQAVVEIARMVLAVSALVSINLPALVAERWKAVEKKSIFYDPTKTSTQKTPLPVSRIRVG